MAYWFACYWYNLLYHLRQLWLGRIGYTLRVLSC